VTEYSLSETEYSFPESTRSDWFFGQLSAFDPFFGRVKLVPSIFNHSGRNRGVRFVKQHTEVTVLALLSIKVRVLTISGVHL